MPRERAQTVNVSEVNSLGSEDRRAVMEMVRDGEMSVEEAVQRVKQMTNKDSKGMKRRGGMKKFRGRLDLEVRFQKASAYSVLLLSVKKGRELMQVTSSGASNPVVKAWITGGDKRLAKEKCSKVHKNTRNPHFEEQFMWELRSNADKQTMRLVIQVENQAASLFRHRKTVIGAMSFSVEAVWAQTEPITGWYRMLDETRGGFQNIPYKHNKPILSPAASATPTASPAPGTASPMPAVQHRPLPPPPNEAPPVPTSPRPMAGRDRSRSPQPGRSRSKSPQPVSAALRPKPAETAPRPRSLIVPGTEGAASPSSPGRPTSPFHSIDSATAGNPFISEDAAAADDTVGNPFLQTQQLADVPRGRQGTNQVTKRRPTHAQQMKAMKPTVGSFTYLKVLGQGSFGKVLLAEHKQTKEIYAIKIIKKAAVIEDDDVEATMTERRVLALSSGCPFLTGLHATFHGSDKLFYVMELISGGDLMFHIQNDKVFSVGRAKFYSAEICLGLWYLHDNGVIYRDLKLDNVMLDEDGHVKIADFGMCKENIRKGHSTSTFCGTPGYLAPEIIREVPYGHSVDWWALGVLMYEMMVGDTPFEADDDDELFQQILTHKPDYPRNLPQTAKEAIQRFLTRDPRKRLACDAQGRRGVEQHPFFADIDWAKLAKRQLQPPFKPKTGKSKRDAVNFDDDFTREDPTVSPADMRETRNIDQTLFAGFSFATKAFLWAGTPAAEAQAPPQQQQPHKQRQAYAPSGTVRSKPQPQQQQQQPGAAAAADLDAALRGKRWYRPTMRRQDVTEALRAKPLGTCVLRESTTQPDCFVLSIAVGTTYPWSGLVSCAGTPGAKQYRLFEQPVFDDVVRLMDHYTDNPVTVTMKGAPVTLRT